MHPQVWGHGYASQATRDVAGWAFRHDIDEIFAVVQPGNTGAEATVRRTA
jgi:RimJ/RimL family protein N-acetyltransferase